MNVLAGRAPRALQAEAGIRYPLSTDQRGDEGAHLGGVQRRVVHVVTAGSRVDTRPSRSRRRLGRPAETRDEPLGPTPL